MNVRPSSEPSWARQRDLFRTEIEMQLSKDLGIQPFHAPDETEKRLALPPGDICRRKYGLPASATRRDIEDCILRRLQGWVPEGWPEDHYPKAELLVRLGFEEAIAEPTAIDAALAGTRGHEVRISLRLPREASRHIMVNQLRDLLSWDRGGRASDRNE